MSEVREGGEGGKKEMSTGNYSNRLENIRTLWHETVGPLQGSLYPDKTSFTSCLLPGDLHILV